VRSNEVDSTPLALMPIPLRVDAPNRGAFRFLPHILSVVFGVGSAAWFYFSVPGLTGWQRWAPVAIGVVFVASGIVGFVRELRMRADREADQRALEQHADAPWRVRPEWRERDLHTGARLDRSFLAFTLAWNVFAWFFTYLAWTAEPGTSEGPAWIVGFFPLIGLGFIAKVGVDLARIRKFGDTVLSMEPMPYRLGRPCRGTVRVRLRRDALPEDGFLVRLSCMRQQVRYVRESDGDRKRRIDRSLLWRDETRLSGAPTMGGTHVEVPFEFEVPADVSASTPLPLDNRVLWEVAVEAAVPGLDLDARFEIPVFPPDASSIGSGRAAGAEVESGAPQSLMAEGPGASGALQPIPQWSFDEPLTRGIELIEEPDLFELRFSAARRRKDAVIMGVLGAALLAGAFPLLGVSLLGGALLLLMGPLLLYGSVQQATNDTVLRVEDGRIEVTHDGVGMPEDVDFAVELVEEVRVDAGSSAADNTRYTLALVARADEDLGHLQDQSDQAMTIMSRFGMDEEHPAMEAMRKGALRPTVPVAYDLSDKDEADWLAFKIQEAVDRARSGSGEAAPDPTD
jgi:hypothetical protein